MKIVYGSDGYVLRVITQVSPDIDLESALSPGESIIDGEAEPGIDRVVLGELVRAPARPSPYHVFDRESASWLLDLNSLRELTKQRITAARNAEEGLGFMAYGKLFDSDAQAIQRISIAVQAASSIGASFSIEWTCADNSTITLDYSQMLALPAFMADTANSLHIKARTLKAAVDAAQTVEDIL